MGCGHRNREAWRAGAGGVSESRRATINPGRCCGYGICAELCPQVFQLDDMGFVLVQEPLVPAELVDAAREACESCPESAISLEPGRGTSDENES